MNYEVIMKDSKRVCGEGIEEHVVKDRLSLQDRFVRNLSLHVAT